MAWPTILFLMTWPSILFFGCWAGLAVAQLIVVRMAVRKYEENEALKDGKD